ncbi:MAG TPA: alkaline phosphatase family protein [Leeuwenhoekiella sp.]|nr:alkaline phosphatase family protein [Leeuwenhoekiella sp.]
MKSKFLFLVISCFVTRILFAQSSENKVEQHQFTIAFGSCNKVGEPNPFWGQISKIQPDLFIWGGDNIYADTGNMRKMKAMYNAQNANPAYAKVKQEIPIMATWDDHDYGKNDAGKNWRKKEKSQQLFLDFIGVAKNDSRRNRAGVYHSKIFEKNGKTVKIIVLDTRYFRSDLTPSPIPRRRYGPAPDSSGTILGEQQWQWLEGELNGSSADYNIIVSSIQMLSGEHGFETWGNFPKEVDRFLSLLKSSAAKRVIVLSGDRHISEFSKMNMSKLNYPLIDFTSSGLTHAYTAFNGEPNTYRVGDVIAERAFGLLDINLESDTVIFQIIGSHAQTLEKLTQKY